MYKFLDCHYDKSSLSELFSTSNKARIKSMYQVNDEIYNHPSIVALFEQCPFISHNRFNVELGIIDRYVPPYISPGNNGLVLFPISGTLKLNFYSYPGTRETLGPFIPKTTKLLNEIESTLIEAVLIDRPTVFNGLVTHSYGPVGDPALLAVLKIPLDMDWNNIDWRIV